MELVSYLKITSEPIHARKGKLAPINPLKCKRQELKIRGDLSPKVQGLPKIHTLNHSQLTQYMSCGGIKLNLRFNLSVEKRRKQSNNQFKEITTTSIMQVKKVDDEPHTAPITIPQNRKGKKVIFPLRKSKILQNPEDLKYIRRLIQIPAQEVLLGTNKNRQPYAFFTSQNCYISIHPCQSNIFEPPSHPNILNPFGVVDLGNQKYALFKEYESQCLRQMLSEFGRVSAKMTKTYIQHLVSAVLHLHRNGLTHNRINLWNVYHDGAGKVLINWYGASKGPITEQQKKKNFYYFPPEALLSRNYYQSPKNDVWGIGCITLQLMCQGHIRDHFMHPYNRTIDEVMTESGDVLRKVRQMMTMLGLEHHENQFNESNAKEEQRKMSVLGLDFISMCLSVNIDRRAEIGQLLTHPFLAQ